MKILVELEDAPQFISGLLFFDWDGKVCITVKRSNDSEYGSAVLSRAEIINMLDLLGVE
jgi:hypothetical protein